MAKKRKYSETLILEKLSAKEKKLFFKKVKEQGFQITHGGRYYSIIGKNTGKGKAIKILTKFFKKEFNETQTIGLGDSLNDLGMLKAVDVPVLVQKPSRIWDPKIKVKNLIKIKKIGPQGWVNALKSYVQYV